MKLISCVLPTRERRELARKAVECFLRQSYPSRELVILDDADARSFPEGFAHPLVRYQVAKERLSIPPKRNAVNALAEGEIIAHWDSDDYSDPERLGHQMGMMESSGKAVCGYHSILFHEDTGRIAKYEADASYAVGTSLFYLKTFWEAHPFGDDRIIRSDNAFVRDARIAGQLYSVDAEQRMVARSHSYGGSVGPKPLSRFGKATLDMFPPGFFEQ